jgi:hypothetical protein
MKRCAGAFVRRVAPRGAARLRIVIDDLVHLILGLQLLPEPRWRGLPTGLSRSRLTKQFFGLLPGLRAPLMTRREDRYLTARRVVAGVSARM